MSIDGSAQRLLVEGGERPSWAPPDSRHIVYEDGRGRIAVVDTETLAVRTLVEGNVPSWSPDGRSIGGGSLAWSPDGRSLVLAEGPLVVLDLRSGRRREIVPGDATHSSPDWQPRCTRAGTARADRLAGGSGHDLLCGFGGRDRLRGGPGRDRLFGGAGDGSVEARDRAFDVVGCGPGRDVVLADRRDLVGEDCERVVRRSG
jgi:hypothetical protein